MRQTTIAAAVLASCMLAGGVSRAAQPNPLNIKGGASTTLGIYIKDLEADTVVYFYGDDRAMTPASVTKAFTTASAMTLLGPDYQFETPVYLTGKRNGSAWDGTLVVRAGGDPTLESRHFESWGGICDSIAARLRAMGVDRIEGGVRVDENMPEQGPAEQWEIEDVPWSYGAGHFDLNWRDNTFTLSTASGATEPHVPGLKVTKLHSRGSSLKRGILSDHLYVYGPRLNRKSNRVRTSMPHPAPVFKYELEQTLGKAGIELGRKQYDSDRTTEVYTHRSAPLQQVMRSLMLRSDNLFAEGVLRAMAPDSARSVAVEREMQLWRDRGIDTESAGIIDGSGLSRGNCFSPRLIGDVLEYMALHEDSLAYLKLFALAGVDGTVRSFMADTPLSGRLALKTGSMNGVQTYAGYALNEKGSPSHVVVVFANNMRCGRPALRAAISRMLLEQLAAIIPEESSDKTTEQN